VSVDVVYWFACYSGGIFGNPRGTDRKTTDIRRRTDRADENRARHSIMEIAAKLFPDTNGAVDRLRAEVAARR
jgi:hypothetical protein